MQRTTARSMAQVIAISTVALATSSSLALAWNIICGVSIALDKATDQTKWDADSRALRGLSFFYLGASELQRLNLNNDGTFTNPDSLSAKGTSATEAAAQALKNSVEEFTNSIELAKKLNLGDKKGLALLNSLNDGVTGFYKDITVAKHLPTLTDLQKISKTANEYVTYGIELSQNHLHIALPGHGEGGPSFNIK
jgi:hypothetical protein